MIEDTKSDFPHHHSSLAQQKLILPQHVLSMSSATEDYSTVPKLSDQSPLQQANPYFLKVPMISSKRLSVLYSNLIISLD